MRNPYLVKVRPSIYPLSVNLHLAGGNAFWFPSPKQQRQWRRHLRVKSEHEVFTEYNKQSLLTHRDSHVPSPRQLPSSALVHCNCQTLKMVALILIHITVFQRIFQLLFIHHSSFHFDPQSVISQAHPRSSKNLKWHTCYCYSDVKWKYSCELILLLLCLYFVFALKSSGRG